MLDWIRNVANNVNWIVVLSSLIVNGIFLVNFYFRIRQWLCRRKLNKIPENIKGQVAMSIGFGSTNPIEKVKQFATKYPDMDILPPIHKTHAGKPDDYLNEKEILDGLEEVRGQVGEVSRASPKEVLVFYAGPLAAALQIGFYFRNFPCRVRFMQLNHATKEYYVMAVPV